MPWDAKTFKKHNSHLSTPELKRAAKQANVLLAKGLPEVESIAIANRDAKKKRIPSWRKMHEK